MGRKPVGVFQTPSGPLGRRIELRHRSRTVPAASPTRYPPYDRLVNYQDNAREVVALRHITLMDRDEPEVSIEVGKRA